MHSGRSSWRTSSCWSSSSCCASTPPFQPTSTSLLTARCPASRTGPACRRGCWPRVRCTRSSTTVAPAVRTRWRSSGARCPSWGSRSGTTTIWGRERLERERASRRALSWPAAASLTGPSGCASHSLQVPQHRAREFAARH